MITTKKIIYTAIFLGILSAFLSVNSCSTTDKQMNVLIIISDDLRTELNCYGADHMVTPNIDKLAESGTLFTRAYVQQAVCTASRASFLTGLRPDQTGSDYPYSIYTVEKLLKGNRPSIMRHFMNEGYYVRTIGKFHHGYKEDFSEPSNYNRQNAYVEKELNKLNGNDRIPYECADVSDETYSDGAWTLDAIETLHRMSKEDEPFFLGLGLVRPHLPWNAPKKYWDLYDPDSIPLSPNPDRPENAPEYVTSFSNLQKYSIPEPINGRIIADEDVARKMKHAYAASVSYVDANVGKIVDELDALGLRENTIVILISDHGWHLGDQNHWGKSTNFENSTHAPMIISAPGYKSDQLSDALVEYVDIFPSLCELAGVNIPEYLEGNSVVPLLKEPERQWKTAVFSQYPRGYPRALFEGYTIRTDRYRYTQWRELDGSFKDHELYDHENDPNESRSVVNNSDYQEVLEDLKKQLNAGWKAALPAGIENLSNNPPAPEFVPWGPEARFGPYAKKKSEDLIQKY